MNSSTPYGYGVAANVVDMGWSVDSRENRASQFARLAIRRFLGFDLIHAYRNRREMRQADVVWTHTERESLAALWMLGRRRKGRPSVIAQTVWLWDEWDKTSALRRWLYRRLLARADVEITHSKRNRDFSRRTRGVGNVFLTPFGAGVNEELLHRTDRSVAEGSGGFVMAVGSDRHRDWGTLHSAARLLPHVQFRVATLSPDYPAQDAPSNVVVENLPSLETSYLTFRAASAIVLPLTENLHASGCTVALETQWQERPLVTTPVGGLDFYLGSAGVHLYHAGDAASLAAAITEVLTRQEAGAVSNTSRAFLLAHGLTMDDYVARYVHLTRWLTNGEPSPELVEAPTPMRMLLKE